MKLPKKWPETFVDFFTIPSRHHSQQMHVIKNGGHRTRSGENSHSLTDKAWHLNENPPFYQCAHATVCANDARKYYAQ